MQPSELNPLDQSHLHRAPKCMIVGCLTRMRRQKNKDVYFLMPNNLSLPQFICWNDFSCPNLMTNVCLCSCKKQSMCMDHGFSALLRAFALCPPILSMFCLSRCNRPTVSPNMLVDLFLTFLILEAEGCLREAFQRSLSANCVCLTVKPMSGPQLSK